VGKKSDGDHAKSDNLDSTVVINQDPPKKDPPRKWNFLID
jgi:hypothetical protein